MIGPVDVNYFLSASQLNSSKLVNHEYFKTGKYLLVGALTLQAKDQTVLTSIPVTVMNDLAVHPSSQPSGTPGMPTPQASALP